VFPEDLPKVPRSLSFSTASPVDTVPFFSVAAQRARRSLCSRSAAYSSVNSSASLLYAFASRWITESALDFRAATRSSSQLFRKSSGSARRAALR
jgi:hypothetical protein